MAGFDLKKGLERERLRAWQTLVAKVEMLALVGGCLILASFAHGALRWSGASEKVSLALSLVFGVTLYWMLAIYWMWAFVEGENRRRNRER